jgi:hypothetical protein
MLDKDDHHVFSAEKMQELVDHYNNTYHETIKKAPYEMTWKDEKKYIFRKVYDQERREKISDYELNTFPFYARFIIPKMLMDKARYRVSKGVVKVTGRDGNGYVCIAADGSTRVMQRWRLFPIGIDKGEYEFEPTLGTKEGVIEQIVRKVGPGKYLIRWTRPDGATDEQTTTAHNISAQAGGKKMLEDFEKRSNPEEAPVKKKKKGKKERERWGPGRKK